MNKKHRSKIMMFLISAVFALTMCALTACNSGGNHTLSRVEEKPATCTEAGHEAYYLCSHCGKLFSDEGAKNEVSESSVVIAALGHDLDHHQAVAATCTENGSVEYWSCGRCGLDFSDEAGTKQITNTVVAAAHKIEYVDRVEPTAEAEGMEAHYECTVCKTCFSDFSGKQEIDRESLVIAQLSAQEVSVTVEIYDFSGNKVDDAAEYSALSGNISLLGAYSTNQYISLSIGANNVLSLDVAVVGSYNVEAYGYAEATFAVVDGTQNYTLKLYKTIAYASGDKVTVNDAEGAVTIGGQDMNGNAWTGSAELVIPSDIGTGSFIFEANLKMGNFSDGWNTASTRQRYAIQLTEGGEGFYLWSWSVGVPKTFIRSFNSQNITNCMLENDPLNSEEEAIGYITTALLSEEGLSVRILRLEDTFMLYVLNNGRYTKVASFEAESYSAKIIFYGVQASYTWSAISLNQLDFVEEKEATVHETGNYAYYTDGEKYFFDDGEETTEQGVITYLPVDVNLNMTAVALDGKTSATLADGTEITFTGRSATYVYTVGGEQLSQMLVGDYTVTAEGYRNTTITVGEAGGEITVVLESIIYIPAAPIANNAWTDSAKISAPADLADDFVFEATLKMGGFTTVWATTSRQRYAIRLTDGNTGFYLWSWFADGMYKTHVRQFTENNLTNAMAEGTSINGNEAALGYIAEALISEGGLQIRILRLGNTFVLTVFNGEEYVKIASVECGEDENLEVEVYGVTCSYEWSKVNFVNLAYHEAQDPANGESGNVAYYTDGTNYWLADGTPTTADDVMVKAVSVNLIFDVKALDGKTSATLADGTEITFTGMYETYVYTVGGEQISQMLAGDYTVTAERYRNTAIVVSEGGGDVTVALAEVIKIGAGSNTLVESKWTGQQTVDIPNTLTTGDFVLEATIKMSDFTNGWNAAATQQRYAIRLTDGNTGFYFWSWTINSGRAHIRAFTADNLANAMAEGADVNDDEEGIGYITEALIGEKGLKIRITRTGTTFTLEALNGDEWATLGTVTCGENEKADIQVFAGVGTYEWSDVTISPVEQQ